MTVLFVAVHESGGPSRHFAASQQRLRLRSKADIGFGMSRHRVL
jgi:hypothetical protein